jgi:hypothetical protein
MIGGRRPRSSLRLTGTEEGCVGGEQQTDVATRTTAAVAERPRAERLDLFADDREAPSA